MYASSEPPVRPSPRTCRSLNVTIGSANPPSAPSDAHAAVPVTATRIAPSIILRLIILRILFLLAVVRRVCRRTVVVSAIVVGPFVILGGRLSGHFCLQIGPPLEALCDFLLESEGSRLVEDAATQLLRKVLLRDVCLWDRMGILISSVVAEVLHEGRWS